VSIDNRQQSLKGKFTLNYDGATQYKQTTINRHRVFLPGNLTKWIDLEEKTEYWKGYI